MYTGRSVFAQLLDVLPRYEFHECVRRYRGNYCGPATVGRGSPLTLPSTR